jgi:hypothetical protein
MTPDQQPPTPDRFRLEPEELTRRDARRAAAALTVFPTGFIAAAIANYPMIPERLWFSAVATQPLRRER